MEYTVEQILSLSPNANNAKRGQKLATTTKWNNQGATDRSVWGECQGSGSKPYYCCIDLTEPAFKCSCPSREFPCKHGVGLLLLYTTNNDYFGASTPPDWVQDWLGKRDARQHKKETQETAEQAPEKQAKRKAAKAKREKDRHDKVEAGLKDLQRWIEDMVRQGLGNLDTNDIRFWKSQATRMVDAQAPGISSMLKEVPSFLHKHNWMELVLERLSEAWLLAKAYQEREHISEALMEDVFRNIGFQHKKEELLQQDGVQDTWQVLGVYEENVEVDLTSRKSWLLGKNTGQYALILDFMFGKLKSPSQLVQGTCFEGELVFYPSNQPQRAVLKTKSESVKASADVQGHATVATFLEEYADTLGKNPIVWGHPCLINAVRPTFSGGKVTVVDQDQQELPLTNSNQKFWKILAISGGHPFTLFGDWINNTLNPVNIYIDGRSFEV